jgi:hypothetical protein
VDGKFKKNIVYDSETGVGTGDEAGGQMQRSWKLWERQRFLDSQLTAYRLACQYALLSLVKFSENTKHTLDDTYLITRANQMNRTKKLMELRNMIKDTEAADGEEFYESNGFRDRIYQNEDTGASHFGIDSHDGSGSMVHNPHDVTTAGAHKMNKLEREAYGAEADRFAAHTGAAHVAERKHIVDEQNSGHHVAGENDEQLGRNHAIGATRASHGENPHDM